MPTATIIPRSAVQKASIKRLATKILARLDAFHKAQDCAASQGEPEPDPTELMSAMGELICDEAERGFVACDVPPQMQVAPWLSVIARLTEEHPTDFAPGAAESLREAVRVYQKAMETVEV